MTRLLTAPKTTNILVVDDTPDNLRLLITLLGEQGYSVRPVTEGPLAINAAQLEPPDLILLDVKMPDMDGYEVCRRLKANAKTCDIPIVFLTVLDDVEDIVKGFEMGGVDYITKPVKAGELLSRIANQVELRSLQRHLMEQEQFLRSIYDSVEASITIVDVLEEGKLQVAAVNETALRFSGMQRHQVEGMYLEHLLPAEVIERNHCVCIKKGISVTREELTDINGEAMWWLTTHAPVRDEHGVVKRLIGTSINITERKQAELQLTQKTEELSQALETLKSTQQELVRSAKMAALGNLVAGVAHEINTPVGTAIMTASTLENASQEIMNSLAQGDLKRSSFESYLQVATECSHLILNNLQQAGELIQSFKQVAVDQSSLQRRTFELRAYLQEVISNLMPNIKGTPHTIVLRGDAYIQLSSYPGAIAQIITNLVINSLTHAYPDNTSGKITISFEPYPLSEPEPFKQSEQAPKAVLIRYQDDGCGIAIEDQGRIFEPFYTTARDQGGSGLGLHLVYNLVTQKLAGSIQLSSRPDHGTTFTITLPVKLAAESSQG